jgi:hypothetical protein
MTRTAEELPTVWRVSELAEYLDVSDKTVREAIERDQVPGVLRLSDRTVRIVVAAFLRGVGAIPEEGDGVSLIEGGSE